MICAMVPKLSVTTVAAESTCDEARRALREASASAASQIRVGQAGSAARSAGPRKLRKKRRPLAAIVYTETSLNPSIWIVKVLCDDSKDHPHSRMMRNEDTDACCPRLCCSTLMPARHVNVILACDAGELLAAWRWHSNTCHVSRDHGLP